MNHNHNLEEQEEYVYTIIRIVFGIILFVLGLRFTYLFIIAYIITGFDIIIKAVSNIIRGEIFDENFLMSLATLGAICIKEFPEAAAVMILYQIGEYLQDKAVSNSKKSVKSLIELRPEYAVVDGQKVTPQNIKVGDIITVSAGEQIPIDGIVINGNADIDTSPLTGEPIPKIITEGDEVLSGCINLNGVLKIRTTKEFEESAVQKIIKLIETSSEKKAHTEKFITKFAKIYTPIVVLMAILITTVPVLFFSTGPFIVWFKRALTFLVISCPCALIISIPLSFFSGIGFASKNGILVKGGNYIEQLSKAKTIVFDKTGTLTNGKFKIKEINSDNTDILKYAAIAENISSHPIAEAIKNTYKKEIPETINIKEYAGKGIEAYYENTKIKVGNAEFIGTEQVDSKDTIVYISINESFQGYIILTDTVKKNADETIKLLKHFKVKTIILTGDTQERTKYIQNVLNIDEYYSGLLPEDKVSILENILSKTNFPVVYVGDGINDAPVIKRADIGIAMGGIGANAAIEAADIIIMDDNLKNIIKVIQISKNTMKIVYQNITLAISLKIIFLIFASFGLVTMWWAVFADVGVCLITILNSMKIKYCKFK